MNDPVVDAIADQIRAMGYRVSAVTDHGQAVVTATGPDGHLYVSQRPADDPQALYGALVDLAEQLGLELAD